MLECPVYADESRLWALTFKNLCLCAFVPTQKDLPLDYQLYWNNKISPPLKRYTRCFLARARARSLSLSLLRACGSDTPEGKGTDPGSHVYWLHLRGVRGEGGGLTDTCTGRLNVCVCLLRVYMTMHDGDICMYIYMLCIQHAHTRAHTMLCT